MKKIFRSLIVCLLIVTLFSSNCYAVKAHIDYSKHCNDKITNELSEIISNTGDDEIPVMIWLDYSMLNVDKTAIISEVYKGRNITSAEQIDNLSTEEKFDIIHSIREKNTAEMKELCKKYNENCANELQKYGQIEYVDSHAPFILMKLTAEQIKKVSRNSNTRQIHHNDGIDVTPLLGISRQVVRANTVQTNGVFGETGNGVRVGIIDEGIPDITNESLQNANITIDSRYSYVVPHATYMAQVIAGQECETGATGIAPDVSLYCTCVPNGSEYYFDALKWLVDSDIDVVNISLDWSILDSSGKAIRNSYYGTSQILDYYSDKYMITYVVGCGNSGTDGIGAPAMSYNAISVANVDDNDTVSTTDDSIYYSSSHINQVTLTDLPSKPDLCAPGTSIVLDAKPHTGTSLAAPHITGVAALIGEMDPLLLVSPPAMKATLIAGAKVGFRFVPSQRTVTTDTDNPPESYIQCGAGLIDAVRSGYIVKNYQVDFSVMAQEETEIIFTINCSANADTRVALVFEKSTPEYSEGIWYTDRYDNLDLYVYDSNGNLIGSSVTTNNNVEIVDFLTTSAGTYTIKIKRVATEYPTDVRFAYAWL